MDINTAREQFDPNCVDNLVDRMAIQALLTTDKPSRDIYTSLNQDKNHFYWMVKHYLGEDFLKSRMRDLELRFLQRQASEAKTLADENTVSVLSIVPPSADTHPAENNSTDPSTNASTETVIPEGSPVDPKQNHQHSEPDPETETRALEFLSKTQRLAYQMIDEIMRSEQPSKMVSSERVNQAIRSKYGHTIGHDSLSIAKKFWKKFHPWVDDNQLLYLTNFPSGNLPIKSVADLQTHPVPTISQPLPKQVQPISIPNNITKSAERQVNFEFSGIKMSWSTNADNVEEAICKVLDSVKNLISAKQGDNCNV